MITISQSAYSQWLCPWENRLPITITETSSTDLSDHQVRIDIAFQTGMKGDFSDLRFTSANGTTTLDFWVEYYEDSTSAIAWVEIPSLPNSSSIDIYLYYGNPSATNASNADNTFVFFDDFSTWSGWSDYGTGVVQHDTTKFSDTKVLSKLSKCDPNGGYKEIGATLSEFRLIAREIRLNEGGTGCSWNRYGLENQDYNGYNIRRNADGAGTNKFGFERRNSGSHSNVNDANFNQPRENWYRTELRRCEATTNNISSTLYNDDRTVIGSRTGTDTTYDTFDRLTIRGGFPYYVDFMAVAKYTCSDPTYVIGTLEQDVPTASCQDITIELDNNGAVAITANDIDNGSSNQCGFDTMTISKTDFDCSDIGSSIINFTATDIYGNTASCTANVTVEDNLAPSIDCPDDITITANTTTCAAIVNWDAVAINDNCGLDEWKSNFEPGDTFPIGITTVTYQASDLSGNTNNCSFTITVVSTSVNPVISITDNSGNTNNDGLICSGDDATLDVGAGYDTYSWSTSETTSGISVSASNTYSITVTDNIGCTGTASTNITALALPEAGTCNVVHDHCMEGTGSLELQVSGGTAPYQFSWTPNEGSTSSNTINNSGEKAIINNITGGTTISITVTDANGCSIQ